MNEENKRILIAGLFVVFGIIAGLTSCWVVKPSFCCWETTTMNLQFADGTSASIEVEDFGGVREFCDELGGESYPNDCSASVATCYIDKNFAK